MPHEFTDIDPEYAAVLDRICETQGIATRAMAAEWLLKRRLDRCARQITMRGRPLQLIRNKDPQ